MKTIAFAGQYPLLKQLVQKYSRKNYTLDMMNHQMTTGEQVKILVSKDPFAAEPNRYQWTHGADFIFVCVDANHIDFMIDFNEEIQAGSFDRNRIILVGHANDRNGEVFEQFQEFALNINLPLIYSFVNTDDAYFAKEGNVFHQNFNTILDNVINDTFVVEPVALEDEPVQENKRRRCRIM